MSGTADNIWFFAITLAALGGIPYLVWIILTATKRQWRKLVYQVAIPAFIYGILFSVTTRLNAAAYESYLAQLFDVNATLGEPVFKYHSERAFNGDGYSIEIYELPHSIRSRFEAADARLLSEYPKPPAYRDGWTRGPWRSAPIDEKYEKLLSFALSDSDADQCSELRQHYSEIRAALSLQTTFFSFFANLYGDHPGDIDLFIVDLNTGRLYTINHNT